MGLKTSVCTLGSASGLPTPKRFGQTIVLTFDGVEDNTHQPSVFPIQLILDTGDGASSLLAKNGYDHRLIAGVVISHMHADHHGGFAQFVKTSMHLARSKELVVCAPQEGIKPLKTYLEASYLRDELLGFPIRWIPLTDCIDSACEITEALSLQAYPNQHMSWVRDHFSRMNPTPGSYSFESYSVVLKCGNHRVVYSGNLDGPKGTDEMASFIKPCNLLITELAHVNPVELGRFLASHTIGHAVIAHFHPKWDSATEEEILGLIRQGAGSALPNLTLANDGMVVEFVA